MKPACSYLPECVAGTTDAEAQAWVASAPELALRAGLGDFDAEVMAWLSESFRRHVADGVSVEAALRLDRASRTRARNDALHRAAAVLGLGGAGDWTIADRLEKALARHERKQGAPETPLEQALAAAFASGVRIPETAEGLFNIVRLMPKKLPGNLGGPRPESEPSPTRR